MSDVVNLRNVLESVVLLMEIAEEMEEGKLSGKEKREYVMIKMKHKLGQLLPSYEYEINTMLETIIFLSRFGRKIHINEISKNCSGCFNFI